MLGKGNLVVIGMVEDVIVRWCAGTGYLADGGMVVEVRVDTSAL